MQFAVCSEQYRFCVYLKTESQLRLYFVLKDDFRCECYAIEWIMKSVNYTLTNVQTLTHTRSCIHKRKWIIMKRWYCTLFPFYPLSVSMSIIAQFSSFQNFLFSLTLTLSLSLKFLVSFCLWFNHSNTRILSQISVV